MSLQYLHEVKIPYTRKINMLEDAVNLLLEPVDDC